MGLSISEMARRLGRHRSTIQRGLARNRCVDGYRPDSAERRAWVHGHRHEARKVAAVHRLREVLCLYGFTRLEPAPVAADGDLEEVCLAVEGASLGDADWLPAIE